VLRREEVTGVDVPDSNFLRDPELATARVLATFWRRIRGATTGQRGPGPHGNALVSTRVLPGGDELSPDRENPVVASADLAFQVTFENSGNSQLVRVRVRLTVDQEPDPIRRTATVAVIDPGERETVTFRNLGQIVQFAERVPVEVTVVPVAGEENRDNNTATYPVTFRIG
jgi:CARDB